MEILIKLLGEEGFEALKVALGDGFDAFIKTIEEAKLVSNVEDEYVLKTEVEEVTPILGDGWLSEEGVLDVEKILDEQLKAYVVKLNDELKEGESKITTTLITNALKDEANKLGVIDFEDILKFIDIEEIKVEDGVVVGVEATLKKLKEEKGYLFKQDAQGGFNPSKGNKATGYVDGMSIEDAYDLM